LTLMLDIYNINQMTISQYKKIRIVLVIAIAMVFSQSIILHNFIVPIAVLAVSSLFLFYLRKRVKEVLADERDYLIGGKSALLAIQLFSMAAVVTMFILYSMRDANVIYGPIAMTLSLSVCALMMAYSIIFRIKAKRGPKNEK